MSEDLSGMSEVELHALRGEVTGRMEHLATQRMKVLAELRELTESRHVIDEELGRRAQEG